MKLRSGEQSFSVCWLKNGLETGHCAWVAQWEHFNPSVIPTCPTGRGTSWGGTPILQPVSGPTLRPSHRWGSGCANNMAYSLSNKVYQLYLEPCGVTQETPSFTHLAMTITWQSVPLSLCTLSIYWSYILMIWSHGVMDRLRIGWKTTLQAFHCTDNMAYVMLAREVGCL